MELCHAALPGTVLAATAEGIVVAAGENALRLTRIQLAGRKATTAADFLNAHRIVGERFSAPATQQMSDQ
jgi:methionyl-tRNA formyltransferase